MEWLKGNQFHHENFRTYQKLYFLDNQLSP